MILNVKLFAQASDLVGSAEVAVTIDDQTTVADLRKTLQTEYPQLKPIVSQLFVAINNDYANDSQTIPEHAEVACFPPVSGG